MLHRASLTLATVLLAAVLAACTSSPPPAPAQDGYRASLPPRPGGTAVLADFEAPRTLVPLTAETDAEVRDGTLLFASLWGQGPGLRPYPDLARRVPTPANGGVVVARDDKSMAVDVRLVPGLRWSDGQPITADDVVFTWQALRDPALQPLAPEGLERIRRMDRRSATEVVWTFDGVDAGYVQLGAALPVLPAHRLRQVAPATWPRDGYFQQPDVVSGPFAPAESVPGDHLTLAANPHYGDGRSADGAYPDGDGPFDHAPYLERVVLEAPGSKAAEKQALLAHGVDAGFHLLPDDLSDLAGQPPATGAAPVVTTGLRDESLNPNHGVDTATGQAPPWAGDPRVLQALDEAVDRTALVRDVPAGSGRPARGLFPRALEGFAGGTVLPAGPQLDAARRLLDAAGWRPGADGVRGRDGRRLAFDVLAICGRPSVDVELDRLHRQWLALGAAVTTGCLPRDEFLRRSAAGAFAMTISSTGWAADPDAWVPVGTSGQPDNWNRCQDRALDTDLVRVRTTLGGPARAAAAARAEREWLRTRCTIPLFEWPDVRVVSGRLRNFTPNAAAADTWNAADWWVAPG